MFAAKQRDEFTPVKEPDFCLIISTLLCQIFIGRDLQPVGKS